MDTESMIENAVSGYKTKISTLQQKRTKVEWQQEVYRSIIGKMSSFSDKYTSYASSTNLLSSSFFNQAVKVTAAGKYADMVSASGKTSSSVQILGVKQLARAATYTVSGIGGKTADKPEFTGSTVDLSEKKELSNVSGSLTIKYGGDRSYTIDFGELDIYESADKLADAIRSKLGEQTMTLSDGTSVKVSERIDVKVNGEGNIEFSDKTSAGNAVTISGTTGKLKENLDVDGGTLKTAGKTLSNKDATLGEYLSGKELTLTLDGVTKKITLPEPEYKTENGTLTLNVAGYKDKLQEAIKGAFGAGKVTVTAENQNGNSFALKFSTQAGSTMAVSGDAAKALGLDKATTYVNTSKTLGELLDGQKWNTFNRIEYVGDVKKVKNEDGSVYYTDAKGNRLKKDGEKYYRVDGKDEYLYEFKINDTVVGEFSKNTALETVLTSINGNADAGVTVNYSKTTNQFQFTARETGAASRIEMGDGLAKTLFGDTKATGASYTAGEDAIFSMKVNERLLDGVKRSSNTFDVDGMSVSLKGTFGTYKADGTIDQTAAEADAVSFTASSDADKIIDAIKSMVEDYNAMVTEIKNAYSTLPQQKSNGKYYEPLTEEDKADMSESSIKAYEEKAKQGLLFADRDLSSLYSQLTSAISMSGKDGADLKAIGITSNYSNGLTTLSLNEEKLRAALETDADKVRDVFSKSMDSGASSNGLMQALKSPLDMYSKVQGTKGILVQKAGSTLAPSTLYKNTLQNKLDDIDTQIEKWQDKMADQVDRYTSKFTALEKLIAQMNSQSSALASFLGTNG
ncbi:flagellar filament capping protein FliD [Oscillibacter valericigenes]|nr:flagellar filament capping protein FliD [Oscillibacter valericigenes]